MKVILCMQVGYGNLIYIKVRIFIAKRYYSLKLRKMHKLISLTWWKFHWKHLTTLAKQINRKPFWLFGQAAHLKFFCVCFQHFSLRFIKGHKILSSAVVATRHAYCTLWHVVSNHTPKERMSNKQDNVTWSLESDIKW